MSTRGDLTRRWRDLMRSWGFTVLEAAGWETRDAEPGTAYDPSRMFLEHHDASTVLSGNWGALPYVTSAKLAQLVYSRDGQAMIVAAGVTWHAGVGGPFADIPANQGNWYSMAVEVANSGSEPYSPALTRLIIAGEAAWCIVHGRQPDRVRGHKEWATPKGRKSDPSIDMNQRRADVAAFLANPTQGDDVSMANDPALRGAITEISGNTRSTNGEVARNAIRLERIIAALEVRPVDAESIAKRVAELIGTDAFVDRIAEKVDGVSVEQVREALADVVDDIRLTIA